METIKRVGKYGVTGAISALIQITALKLFVGGFHIWYLYASIAAHALSVILNFFLQKVWVFKEREGALHVQAGQYALLALLNVPLNMLGMYTAVDVLHINYIVAQAIVIVLIFCFNFFVSNKIIFKQ